MNNTRRSISKPVFPALIAVLAFFVSTNLFASSPAGQFEKSLSVNGPVDLEVLTRSGNVMVRAGSSGSVFVRGKIFVGDSWLFGGRQGDVHSIEQNPPIHQNGNSVHIDYVNERNISIDYEITVPADTSIRSHTGSGDQSLEGTHGNVDVQTGSGNVRLVNVAGEVRLQTGSGDVRGHGVSGAIKGGTGSGNVEIEETGSGDLDLHTGSGNIQVRGVQGSFRGEAGSGDITAEGRQSGPWDIHTGSGTVNVRLPGNAAYDADIATSSGSIDLNSPIEMTVQGRVEETRRHIRGKVRGGGPFLSIRTGSGDIRIQ
jgi:hypothetical protein